MPTVNASPTTVSEVLAAAAAGFAILYFEPPKDEWLQIVSLTAGATFFLSRWLIDQDTGLFDQWEEGVTFATSAPIVFGLMWAGMIATSYIGLALAFVFGGEFLLPVFEVLGPLVPWLRWIMNPFSLNYLKIIAVASLVLVSLFSAILAYPILALLDVLGDVAAPLKPVGVEAYQAQAGFGGRDKSGYGWQYLPKDIIQLVLSYPLTMYGAVQALFDWKILPLLTVPITGWANIFHRLGDVIYDFHFIHSSDALTPCLDSLFVPPPTILDPGFSPDQYNYTCKSVTGGLVGWVESWF